MKKITVFLLMCMLFTIGSAAGKKKITDKEYNGEYVRSTNTFTYKKDNLIFKDKILTYQLQDNSELLNGIYEFIGQNYGVTDDDIIGLNVVGKVSGGTLVVTKITNYRVPEYKMNNQEAENSETSTDTEIPSDKPNIE
ncbi:hypothetical protein EII29_10490 [Leptotrichia sp. OH3620_COT-345]|uniref:hypothetical protein n=1 Tax=Leptotrichia sp. OH3620_COT-345 TaxID=2491048 RepID=UPI000F650894|nr:hypothetical protein [Leptotrichia sp. OH3620_COT-345]RRD38251.1 hypothetical protein EII29_10490 [Leptotrichia sp. OH3620_COT-345]